MDRKYYLDLAASGLRMPIGTDLVLHEHADPQAIQLDGHRLGQVVVETARRFRTPLALAHMNLEVEKAALLSALGIPESQIPAFHFRECPEPGHLEILQKKPEAADIPRLRAQVEAVAHVAKKSGLVPVAMCIGPFSLATKLLEDPIGAIFISGSGATAQEEEEVRRLEKVLELAQEMVLISIRWKIAAGAKVVCIAEPAANQVYFSPRQLNQGSDIFDRYVMNLHRQIKALLDQHGVDLFFHCCGELIESQVRHFASLDPVILSLGSSRKLWEDARLVSKRTVLFGNLPSKRFYSDQLVTQADVVQQARELERRMKAAEHPFIMGSECDVLSVAGCTETILAKVQAFQNAAG